MVMEMEKISLGLHGFERETAAELKPETSLHWPAKDKGASRCSQLSLGFFASNSNSDSIPTNMEACSWNRARANEQIDSPEETMIKRSLILLASQIRLR